ncbi:DUF1269 domain-containing protein [Alkalilimnicola ehrlichii]|uniref:DUF1269 domain-containing protein n=1 Tax=Alkalilimnicola ehrlichii TaxID=351052 RepID=A0A3E0X1J2_9GAMM|nr:DUF1269 domain-containing protein [Alkalilimnicola ehrlichii]RFA31240.1 DUF1269 domain-containing protein [Alkalilimnicola ehrlichii]RFA39481.1 DUF1269 domain-containing protein [Alkalilimnicola ehrlichii]
MRRLYFLVPSVESAKAIVTELLLNHVPEEKIHVIAKEGTPLEDLPEARLRESSDLIPALERGAAIGGATGALAGLAAVALPGLGLVVGGGTVLALTALGGGVGAWASSLQGISTPNSQLTQFQDDIEKGQLLMLVDVPKDRIHEIEDMIKKHHPEADIAGTEPDKPVFP